VCTGDGVGGANAAAVGGRGALTAAGGTYDRGEKGAGAATAGGSPSLCASAEVGACAGGGGGGGGGGTGAGDGRRRGAGGAAGPSTDRSGIRGVSASIFFFMASACLCRSLAMSGSTMVHGEKREGTVSYRTNWLVGSVPL
jgi:hypothetical protein